MELVGTGFFIHSLGIFVTAGHVLREVLAQNAKGGLQQTHGLMAIHLHRGCYYTRAVQTCSFHEKAEVAVGVLAQMAHKDTHEPLKNSVVRLTFASEVKGARVHTYAYPNTVIEYDSTEAHNHIYCSPAFYKGQITEVYPDGRDKVMLPYPCYETSMPIHGGASGGPVFNEQGHVFALNSTGYPDVPDVSFISQLDEILSLSIPNICPAPGAPPGTFTIAEIIQQGQIKVI